MLQQGNNSDIEWFALSNGNMKGGMSTFVIEYSGESMLNAFIPPKAKLVVDSTLTPVNGDVVVAVFKNKFIVRYLKKNEFKSKLVAANRTFQDINLVSDAMPRLYVVIAVVCERDDLRRFML